MTNKHFNKAEFEKEMKSKYSDEDIMVKGKKVELKTKIKNHNLDELIYGNQEIKTSNPIYNKEVKERQEQYQEVWENYKRYN